jgi:tRNA pseudouridine38-40 synthase
MRSISREMRPIDQAGARYRALLEYDGTDYHGFQIQADRPTIQGELERALLATTGAPVTVVGAGRTDAGVHARGQVVSFTTEWKHGCPILQRALNARLPRDIAIRELQVADADFHARHGAASRVYIYTMYQGSVRSPLLERWAHYEPDPLDVMAMAQAAAKLVGNHDFAAFGQPPQGVNTTRQVLVARWWTCDSDQAFRVGPHERVTLMAFEIEANAFLRGMARRVVGTLLLVGKGALGVEEFAGILDARDISKAGPSVPPGGLCLWHVRYESESEPFAIQNARCDAHRAGGPWCPVPFEGGRS